MTVYILLTTAGTDTGPFNLYSDADGYVAAFETGVSKAALLAGYTTTLAPGATTIVRVMSDNDTCTNYIDLPVIPCTTTTSTTTGIGIAIEAIYSNDLITHCSTPTNVVYTDDGTIGPGKTIYNDSALSVPLTGFAYISGFSGTVYNLNPLTAVVGSNSGSSC
jgi:hypothetical protein